MAGHYLLRIVLKKFASDLTIFFLSATICKIIAKAIYSASVEPAEQEVQLKKQTHGY